MRFSERKGYTSVKKIIQIDDISDKLRNKLWNVINHYKVYFADDKAGSKITPFEIEFFVEYLNQTTDEISTEWTYRLKEQILEVEWYIVYDIIETIFKHFQNDNFSKEINYVLEEELSAYRFVNGICTDITSKQEIAMLEEALADDTFPGVNKHLEQALILLSDKKKPDYRNSIKESISAVESLCQIITGKRKATLAGAIKVLEKNGKIHTALKSAYLSIYGYTSDADGIRHGMLEEPDLNAHDAKFFLLSCTSFINYLKTKI